MVALSPRYVIVNAMDRAIEVQQAGLGADVEPLRVGYSICAAAAGYSRTTAKPRAAVLSVIMSWLILLCIISWCHGLFRSVLVCVAFF